MSDRTSHTTDENATVIRPLKFTDVPAAARIDREAASDPWDETALVQMLSQLSSLGFVALRNDSIVGYLLAERMARPQEVVLHRLSVDPLCQRQGIGSALFRRLQSRIFQAGWPRIVAEVRESAEVSQQFLESVGFETVRKIWRTYRDPGEAAIRLECRQPAPAHQTAEPGT